VIRFKSFIGLHRWQLIAAEKLQRNAHTGDWPHGLRRRSAQLAVVGLLAAGGLLGSATAAQADTGPSGVFNPSNQLQDVYYVGATGGMYLWAWTGTTWSNGSLGAGEPASRA
jgi:hypothetical protein